MPPAYFDVNLQWLFFYSVEMSLDMNFELFLRFGSMSHFNMNERITSNLDIFDEILFYKIYMVG